jgi:hypothetical protein
VVNVQLFQGFFGITDIKTFKYQVQRTVFGFRMFQRNKIFQLLMNPWAKRSGGEIFFVRYFLNRDNKIRRDFKSGAVNRGGDSLSPLSLDTQIAFIDDHQISFSGQRGIVCSGEPRRISNGMPRFARAACVF